MDFGTKENVKVENACYMHVDFTNYPKISRECKLYAVAPKFGLVFFQKKNRSKKAHLHQRTIVLRSFVF
jgi:hypothetical protein